MKKLDDGGSSRKDNHSWRVKMEFLWKLVILLYVYWNRFLCCTKG